MIEAIIVQGNKHIHDINKIRDLVNEKNCDSDRFDEFAYHVIVLEKDEPIATGRLLIKEDFIIEKVCVVKDKRRMYIGDLVMKMLLDKAFNLGAIEVLIYVPNHLLDFFSKIGFIKSDCNECLGQDVTKMKIIKTAIKKCSH